MTSNKVMVLFFCASGVVVLSRANILSLSAMQESSGQPLEQIKAMFFNTAGFHRIT
jgi:hypothetical protein